MISYCFSSENVEEAALKSHIFIFLNQKLRVDNSELLNLHKRLSIQSQMFEKYRPMSTVCQHLCTLGVEELNAQLVSLVGENGAEMLISTFNSRRSISGPELDG